MVEEKTLTGYPSIDKPHLKFYLKKPVREIDEDQSLYDLVFKSNQNNMTAPALKYLGKEFTFDSLKEKTDLVAKAFQKEGLKRGDVVLVGLSNCPEAVFILLALNRLGCISKWFDIRAGEKDIEDYIEESRCKIAVVLDMLVPKVESINSDLEKIIVASPVESLSKAVRFAYKIKSKHNLKKANYNFQSYLDFVKQGEDNTDCIIKPIVDHTQASVMIQSSGTTGKPKVIVHSNHSATFAVKELAYSDLPIGIGKVSLDLLPPWIAYAIGEAILYPLALGTKVILCPTFDPDAIMDYLGDFTISMAAPFHYRYLYDHFDKISEKERTAFLNRVECLISGGDKISIEENKAFEELFKAPLLNGWGNNEGWGCLTVNSALHNCHGSVGIPKYGETIISYDNENEEELPYNTIGEICAMTNTLFLGYANNEEETMQVIKIHKDGNKWLHTGDLGYIDREGHVFLQGRLRRVIIRQGFKISAYTIEDSISKHALVKECVAVEVEDKDEEHVPMAFIILKESVDDENIFLDELRKQCHQLLKEYEIPKYFIIVKELPYTQNGKYDFRRLEDLGNEFVKNGKMPIDETLN